MRLILDSRCGELLNEGKAKSSSYPHLIVVEMHKYPTIRVRWQALTVRR
jgi:hypothetical protein